MNFQSHSNIKVSFLVMYLHCNLIIHSWGCMVLRILYSRICTHWSHINGHLNKSNQFEEQVYSSGSFIGDALETSSGSENGSVVTDSQVTAPLDQFQGVEKNSTQRRWWAHVNVHMAWLNIFESNPHK